MKKILQTHKNIWPQKFFILNTIMGLGFLLLSFFINFQANNFSALRSSKVVTDLILDNLPVVNMDLIFSKGAGLFCFILVLIIFFKPKNLPFVLKSMALFIVIRSFFMILTHFAPPHPVIFDPNYPSYLSSGYDLFFSGHTGIPFLMALIFWDEKYLRYFFICSSIIAGSAVLLGHLHYSIDVFSAFFISYGIFKLSEKFFQKDYRFISQE